MLLLFVSKISKTMQMTFFSRVFFYNFMLLFDEVMNKIKLEIVGMSYSQSQSGAYALVLGVPGESRRLPIIIGGFEAQAIAIELEKMAPTRPLTHDLFKNFANSFGISIKEVVINKFEEGIFFSKLLCSSSDGIKEIDSRTSDAVALAIRFKCPIYVYSDILDEAGIVMDDIEEGEDLKEEVVLEGEKLSFEDFLIDELEEMLKKAVAEENFEEASKLRDEINRRKDII